MPFDPNTAVDIPVKEAGKFDPSTAVDIPTPNINVYDNNTKKAYSMPGVFDEDQARYTKLTQIDKEIQSDFWGMSETKNSILSQLARGTIAMIYSLPSSIRSVIKSKRETDIVRLQKAIEGEPVTAIAMAGMFPVGYLISSKQAKREVIKKKETVKKIDELNENTTKFMKKSGLAKTAADGFFYDLASGIGSLGTAVALTAITRNPASAAVLFGAIQKGTTYEELRSKGYSPEYADTVSTAAGGAEAALEFVGLDLFMKGVKGNKIIGRFIKGAITEGLQEASQTTSEELIMQKFGGREKEISETLGDIAYSGLIGALIGAPASVILGAGGDLAEKKGLNRKQGEAIAKKATQDLDMQKQTLKLFDNQIDPLTYPNADEDAAVKVFDETLAKMDAEIKDSKDITIKEQVKTEIMEAGVDEAEAEQVSDIIQARAEAAGSALGISPRAWLESKRLQIKGESPGLTLSEGIQEETQIEDIIKPTEVLFQKEKGQIEFEPDQTTIRLFQGKDKSTLLHETGHLFLRDMQAIADEAQDQQALEDISVVKDWLNVKEDDKFSRENEESFAEGFVEYINTGKAPNAKLVNAFERFKQWLLSLFDKVKGKVDLTEDVKGVFDRMLGGYDVETATNIKTEYGNRVTELQKLTENIKERKLANITQAQLDDLESLINAAKQRPVSEPQSLLQWIKRRGGIWDKGGELADMDLSVGIIRKQAESSMSGQAFYNSLDTVRESAIEEGLLPRDADINALLDAIAKEAKGVKTYRKIDLERVNMREETIQDRNEAELILSQLNINPEEILNTIRKQRLKALKAVPTPEFATALSRIERLERAVSRIATDQKKLTEAQIKAITKADIKDIQTRMIDLIKIAKLEAKDRAKFISTIKNIQTGEQLARILPRLQERIIAYKEQTEKGRIREQIRKELKTIKPATISGKLKGKFDAETQQALETFKTIQNMTVDQSKKALDEIMVKAREMAYEPTELELTQNSFILSKADYANTSQTLMEEVLNTIKTLKSEARIKLFERMEAEKARKEAMVKVAADAIDADKPFDPKSVTTKQGKKIFNYFNIWAHSWNSLLNKVLTGSKEVSENFSKMVEDAEAVGEKLWNKDHEATKTIVKKAYNLDDTTIQKGFSRQMDEFTFENLMGSDNVARTHTLRRGEIISLYSLAKNSKVYQFLTDPDFHAFSEQGLETMFDKLTDGDKRLSESIMLHFDTSYTVLNKFFQKKQGVNLPKVKNYFPVSRVSGEFEGDLVTTEVYQATTTPSAVKRRGFSGRYIKILPILNVLDSYNEQKNKYLSHTDVMRDLRAVFGNQDIRKKVTAKYTANTVQALDEHIKTFGLNKTRDIDETWMKLRGIFVGIKTGLAPAIFLKQLTSAFAYLEVLSPGQFASGMIDFLKSPIKKAKWLRKNSEFLKHRISSRSFDRDLKAMERSKLNKISAVTKWNDFVSMFVRAGDIMAIYPGMWAMIKSGKSIREAERFSNRTQQSASASKMTLAQKGTNIQRLFTMFKSTPLQYTQKLIINNKDFIRGDISVKQWAKVNSIYAIILPFFFSAVSQAFRPFKDENWKRLINTMINSNLSGLAYLSDLINIFSSSLLGVRYFPSTLPFMDEFQDLEVELTKLMKEGPEDVKWDEFLASIIELASLGTGVGIPAKRIWNASEGIYEITVGDKTAKGLLKLGGYADYTAEKATE